MGYFEFQVLEKLSCHFLDLGYENLNLFSLAYYYLKY
jgi:hypothetical protein